jgi:hypothetical protein
MKSLKVEIDGVAAQDDGTTEIIVVAADGLRRPTFRTECQAVKNRLMKDKRNSLCAASAGTNGGYRGASEADGDIGEDVNEAVVLQGLLSLGLAALLDGLTASLRARLALVVAVTAVAPENVNILSARRLKGGLREEE